MKADRFKKAAKLAEIAEGDEGRRGRLSQRTQRELQDWFFIGVMRTALAEQKTGRLSELAGDILGQWHKLSSDERNFGFSTGYGYLR